jgi:hypothetical protein
MIRKRSGRRADPIRAIAAPSLVPSAITSRFAALRGEQITAARRLAAAEIAPGDRPSATCRIATARDRRSPFVYRPPRRDRHALATKGKPARRDVGGTTPW